MIQITDTLTISATRLGDLAREVVLQLGDWQFHKNLTYSVSNWQLGSPTVFFTLTDHADDDTRTEFIDAFAQSQDAAVRTFRRHTGGHLMSVTIPNFNFTGVTVSASVNVGVSR